MPPILSFTCLNILLPLLAPEWLYLVHHVESLLERTLHAQPPSEVPCPHPICTQVRTLPNTSTGGSLLAWFILVFSFVHLLLNHSSASTIIFPSLKNPCKQRTPCSSVWKCAHLGAKGVGKALQKGAGHAGCVLAAILQGALDRAIQGPIGATGYSNT